MIPQTPTERSAPSGTPPTPPASDRQVHEHVAESAKAQAQALVEEVGSVGLAKQAVEALGEAVVNLASNENLNAPLHESLGFASREELDHASTPIESNDGKDWFLTALPQDAWAVWNAQHPKTDRHFNNRDEAIASIPRVDQLSGSSTLD